jgi:molybdopterin/thiamine biosynthesis adenylyltransferase
MSNPYAPEFSRNYGFWSEAEQQAIMDAHVAIGGVGGDGFELGQRLARMGVAKFTVADPEVFEPENANRVPGATHDNYGRKKAEVFREEILRINPEAEVRVFDEGVTKENIESFMEGATLAYDETELTHLELGTMIAREARRRKIPNVLIMNVGFAALATSFHPEDKHTFERMMGIPEDMPIDEVAKQKLDLSRCVPYLPKYVDVKTLKAVEEGAPLPSIVQGVGIASAMGSTQGFLHMVNGIEKHREKPTWAPTFAYMDAMGHQSGEIRFPRLSHYVRGLKMALRSKLGMNVHTSYSETERKNRNDIYGIVNPDAKDRPSPSLGRHAAV